jgi:soluble lytic murein transglycosylase-like protein
MAAFPPEKPRSFTSQSGADMIRPGTFAVVLTLSFTALSQNASAADGASNILGGAGPRAYDTLVARHAAANGLPEALVRRVIMRESRYNPRAVSKGNYGMMQIRLGTAHAMGYRGNTNGLLDADTNMTYAVRYLAGAYRAAGGNHDRAVMNYARGYYHTAKAQGFSPYAKQPAYALAGAPDISAQAREASASSDETQPGKRAQPLRQEADATQPDASQPDSRYDNVESGAN